MLFNACMYRYLREMYQENRESFGSGFCVCVTLVSRYAGFTKMEVQTCERQSGNIGGLSYALLEYCQDSNMLW